MNATALKSEVASYRLMLRNKPAKLVAWGPDGPVNMDLIDILVNAISTLENGSTPSICRSARSDKSPKNDPSSLWETNSQEKLKSLFAIDTRKLDSLRYRKWLNSGGSPWRQNPRVQEQRQRQKLL